MNFYVIANWMQGTALSGGDRIFIELSRRWAVMFKIKFFVSEEGFKICLRENIEGVEYEVWSTFKFNIYGYFFNYLYRTLNSLVNARKLKVPEGSIVYSSSDFWPDALAGFYLKLKNPKILWIAGFYLFAPVPWHKDSPYKGISRLNGFFYWLTQRLSFYFIKQSADYVFVTSEPDVQNFLKNGRGRDKIVVVRGGVDIRPSQNYLASGRTVPFGRKYYDACFIGRFHQQKGVLELVDIWQKVCQKKPQARLAMIGSGPLEKSVKQKIARHSLGNNIDLLGFKDGADKFEVFKNCKIVVHPATYDSGGMAAAEAMAWGLPGVSFDLEALKTYYGRGMLKSRRNDFDDFAANILKLLNDQEYHEKMAQEAVEYIKESWDWQRRAEIIYEKLQLFV